MSLTDDIFNDFLALQLLDYFNEGTLMEWYAEAPQTGYAMTMRKFRIVDRVGNKITIEFTDYGRSNVFWMQNVVDVLNRLTEDRRP